MAKLGFTDQEMRRAWRENLAASDQSPRSNAHRLLLFYAVECGLKAILMRRKRVNYTDLCTEVKEAGHNINKLLDLLAAERVLQLPRELNLSPIQIGKVKTERKSEASVINQVWRYGGYLVSEGRDDKAIETKLKRISEWIKQELR